MPRERENDARRLASDGRKDEAASNQFSKWYNHGSRGKGFGKGKCKYVITCYNCGVEGHNAFEFLEKNNLGTKSEDRTHVTHEDETLIVGDSVTSF